MASRLLPAFKSPLPFRSRRSKYSPLPSQLDQAAKLWEDYQSHPQPADRWLANYFHSRRKMLGAKDRRFLSETLYALFRHRTFLEAWARHLREGSPLFLALLGAASEGMVLVADFEIVLRERFRGIQTGCDLYTALRDRVLPPGLSFDSPEEALAHEFSFPVWLVARWLKAFGEKEAGALLSSLQERPPLVIRVNLVKTSREKLMKRFERKGHAVRATPLSEAGILFKERANLFDTEEFRNGLFEIQDEGSQILCRAIAPKAGEVLWDVCAGGGGKSLYLAALMQGCGRIIATDIRERKLEELRKRARRAGVYNIFPADLKRLHETQVMKKGVDTILVDAPCSGTGTLRRNPDAKWRLREEKLEAFHKEQVAIVEGAIPFLKKGGKLYYATCSLEAEENEEVIREVLSRHPELRLCRGAIHRAPTDDFLRLWPHRDGTDGFFLAVVENTKDNRGNDIKKGSPL